MADKLEYTQTEIGEYYLVNPTCMRCNSKDISTSKIGLGDVYYYCRDCKKRWRFGIHPTIEELN